MAFESRFAQEPIHERQARLRSLGHADGDGAIQFDNR
jgi:hypothetical protein